MKLKNKKTGEMMEFDAILPVKDVKGDSVVHLEYYSLAEFCEEWEDAPEEPKEHWYIDCDGEIICPSEALCTSAQKDMERIGNYFGTKEEAEKAVEKLKAWKRLKDNGFKFKAYQLQELNIKFWLDHGYTEMGDDLDLLFGGEDE